MYVCLYLPIYLMEGESNPRRRQDNTRQDRISIFDFMSIFFLLSVRHIQLRTIEGVYMRIQ